MSDLKPIVLGMAHGLKDSLIGMTALLRLKSILEGNHAENQYNTNVQPHRRTRHGAKTVEKKKDLSSVGVKEIFSKMLQCCLLNGGIFWMSIFLFEGFIIPGLQNLTHFIFNVVSGSTQQQGLWLWKWMGPFLSYLFSALWVLPLYWLSKPLNSLWYQEIADSAYRNTRGRPLGFLATVGKESVSSHISKTVADFFFSFLLQMFFLVQTLKTIQWFKQVPLWLLILSSPSSTNRGGTAMVASFLPILGPVISLGHMCLLYSLYTFEYKWVNMGWTASKRLSYMESNWPYFVGFGLPLAILTSLPPSFIISGCVFAILFPLFIISGNEAKVEETNQIPLRIFSFVIWLTNKIFTRRPVISRAQDSRVESMEGT